MNETDELIVTDVDEWLDESETHLVCNACNPAPSSPGALCVAVCGTLYRLRHGRVGPLGPPPDTCAACFADCPNGCDA